MTAEEKVARRKLSLLELADELENVTKACKMIGYSRQQFYEIRRNYQTFGFEGLLDQAPGAKGPHPNRVPAETEQAILEYCLEQPTHGCLRVSQELALREVYVSSGGVRGVWSRHDLESMQKRLLRLERANREGKIVLSERQIEILEQWEPEFRMRHIETRYTGDLVAVDTFYVGSLKGVGKIYMQSVLDCYSRYAWGRLYTSKIPVTAVHVLHTDVLPFFDEHGARVETILSDNGPEFCGRADRHPYELFLQLEGIEHRTTKVKRPQSNGFIERFHRTLLNEHLKIAGRKKWYDSLSEMQSDLDEWLTHYNQKRPHQGYNMNGRVPLKVFLEGVHKINHVSSKQTA